MSKTFIVFLGRKGGGTRFAQETSLLLNDSKINYELVCYKKNQELITFCKNLGISCETIKTRLLIRIFGLRLKGVKVNLVSLMPSHREFVLLLFKYILGFNFFQIVHDQNRHIGDLYPFWGEISLRTRMSQKVFFLSSSENLKSSVSESAQLFDYVWRKVPRKTNGKILLFAGRMKGYQGHARIPEICNLLPEFRFVISGNSELMSAPSNLLALNGWTPKASLDAIIASSKLILMPYIEATQSGILQQATRAGIPVVITPLPGLMEFGKIGQGLYVSKSTSSEDFALAVKQALIDLELLQEILYKEPAKFSDSFIDSIC